GEIGTVVTVAYDHDGLGAFHRGVPGRRFDAGLRDAVQERRLLDKISSVVLRDLVVYRGVESFFRARIRSDCLRPRHDQDICAEGTEFAGDAALGVHLEVEEGGGDGGARTQS